MECLSLIKAFIKLKKYHPRKGKKHLRIGRWRERPWNVTPGYDSAIMISQQLLLSALGLHNTTHPAASHVGGAHRAPPLHAELMATEKYKGKENHCLQLCAHGWAHQPTSVSMDNSRPKVIQMSLVELSGSWNKTKRDEHEEEAFWEGGMLTTVGGQ